MPFQALDNHRSIDLALRCVPEKTTLRDMCWSMPSAQVTADLDGLCLVGDYRLRRAYEVALRASVVQIWPM